MVLLGQPELREMLSRPELRQLAKRITARYHLMPLDGHEVEGYLGHRIRVAGATRFPFTKLAVKRLHLHTGGVPRLLNGVADRALLAGYARSENPVGERLVDLAAREVLVRPMARLPKPPLSVWIGAGLVALVATFFLPYLPVGDSRIFTRLRATASTLLMSLSCVCGSLLKSIRRCSSSFPRVASSIANRTSCRATRL